jgi:hypothetical protein
MLSIPKSPVAASIFSGLAGIASIYAGPQGFMLELASEKEIASVTADGDGNYRAALPIGAYVLDVQDRAQKHVRAKLQRFTIVSNQTVRVDMTIVTGSSAEAIAPQE